MLVKMKQEDVSTNIQMEESKKENGEALALEG